MAQSLQTWQTFQHEYAKTNPGSSKQQISAAWNEYKNKHVIVTKTSPIRSPVSKVSARRPIENEASMFDRESPPLIDVVYAVQTLEHVKTFGYAGLRAFTLVRVSSTHLAPDEGESSEEVIERRSTICFNGARYLRMWLGEEYITSRRDDIKLVGVKSLLSFDFMTLPRGVYYLDFEGNEGHHFVWIVLDREVVYGGSYGGVCSLSISKYNKEIYFRRFKLAMRGEMDDYAFVFDVTPVVSSVGFRRLIMQRSRIYS